MHDDGGRVTGFMAIERDITSERAARDRLELQFEVSQVLLEGGAPEDVLPRVLAAICTRAGWQGGRAWCFGPEGRRVLAEWGAVDDAAAGPGEVLCEVVASNAPAWTDGAIPRFALPVAVNGVASAAIDLFGVRGGAPSGDLLRCLAAVANQVGLFLARCRAEEGMRQATRAAERAAEARSQFVATVSHEIRTPLDAVIGMASLLALDELAPRQRERLGVIQVASEQLLSILNDVLDLSRMDAGAIEQRQADFRLRDLLDHAMGVARGAPLVSFSVSDTGPGIAPEYRDRIFEPLGQAEAPAGDEARRLRVLVAEDAPASQLVIRAILERLGHSIRLAADGVEAVRAAGEEPFDVVMLDVQMPGMDGYEAARAIRASLPGYGEVPIIGLSALAQRADRARGLDSGMSHYIAKPVRFDDIAALLRRVCAGAPLGVRP